MYDYPTMTDTTYAELTTLPDDQGPGGSHLEAPVPNLSHTPKAIMLAVIAIPFIGVLAAITLAWGSAITWLDVALLLGMYFPAAAGITVGFHRMLTHKAFEAPAWVRGTILALGSMAVEGAALTWAVDHRTHHAHSDRDGDPHSPHAGRGDGLLQALHGLYHAHMGWLFERDRVRLAKKYGKDLMADPVTMFIQRTFLVWAVLGFVIPGLIGGAFGGWRGFLGGVFWGGLVRVFFNHHITWSINSICHVFGRRPFRSTDLATNNWLLAIPSLGESWHHNHHVFPTSARHGLQKGQIDISAGIIRGLEKVGLAWNVRQPSSEQIDRKRK